MNEKIKNEITAFLESREVMDITGNSLLIMQNGKTLYRHDTGTSRPDTLWRIYSMTKVITITCALQLVEQGLIGLEDKLCDYLPEYEHMTVWDEEKKQAVPAKTPITIRHLMTMSAGFTYEGDWAEIPRRSGQVRAEMERQYPGESYTTRQFIRALAQVPLAFEPGTHWQYSLCHDVLGAVIEAASGQTLGEYMAQHIFIPLGMQDTFFRCPLEKRSRIAPFDTAPEYEAKYGPDARYESGGAGLLSTVQDYARFAQTLCRGGESEDGVRILKKETLDLMRTPQLTPALQQDFNWDYLAGYSYGLGVRTMIDSAASGLPGTKGEFGWCGMLGTWVLMDPEKQLTIVYMHQHYPNYEKYVQQSLRKLIYEMIG